MLLGNSLASLGHVFYYLGNSLLRTLKSPGLKNIFSILLFARALHLWYNKLCVEFRQSEKRKAMHELFGEYE